MTQLSQLHRAGAWLLDSGIQSPDGGVSRFYRSEIPEYRAISTEITGYVASALVFLFEATGDEKYLDRARLTAKFLVERGWNQEVGTFPFEYPSPSPKCRHRAYFFDCGIIVRGLLAVWRKTGDERLVKLSLDACRAMVRDFRAQGDYHPIIELPGKTPVARTDHWSQTSGCYQLKSALAWADVALVTGDADLKNAWDEMLAWSVAQWPGFLPQSTDETTRYAVMDRLHAANYFLEALKDTLDRPACAEAYRNCLALVGFHLHGIEAHFVRSDVYAQTLRARMNGAGVVPLDRAFAEQEATALAGFQMSSDDPRIDGGFSFGRRDGVVSPHINPVSTAFAVQALEMWSNPDCPRIVI